MSKVVMTVDDSSSIRQMVSLTLSQAGYTMVQASDGVDALNKLSQNRVDMIITDNQMPLMNGLDFIEHVNQESNGEVLPIFLMTAELSYPVRLRAFKNGVNRVFEKPLDFQELCHAVDWVTKFDLPATATMRCASQG